jgi:hypothetical protein
MNRTMAEVVKEYNELAGTCIKRFSTVESGEMRIAKFKDGEETLARKGIKSANAMKPKAPRRAEKASTVKA